MRINERPLLDEFLYEAIFVPKGEVPPPKSIILNDDLQVYIRDFGAYPDDKCLVVETGGRIVGAVWTRIMKDYGHIADALHHWQSLYTRSIAAMGLEPNFSVGCYNNFAMMDIKMYLSPYKKRIMQRRCI